MVSENPEEGLLGRYGKGRARNKLDPTCVGLATTAETHDDKATAKTLHADTYLISTRGSAGGHGGSEEALVGGDVHLDGGVATGVDDLAGVDLLDRLHGWERDGK